MSERLFGRAARLTLIQDSGQTKIFDGVSAFAQNFNEREKPKGFDVFRIAFSVEQTSESNANNAQISIFNVNRDSRQFASAESVRVILNAGFGENPDILFIGQADDDKTVVERNAGDIILTLICGDGRKELKEATVNQTFEAGASVQQIIESAAQSFGLSANPRIEGVEQETFSQSVTVSDSAKDILDKYTKKQGLIWSIQNGVVEVRKQDQAIADETIVLENIFATGLNQNERVYNRFISGTGLLGIPKKREDGGIEVTSLLNPKLRPGRILEIRTNRPGFEFDGTFVIRRAQHSGDNYRGAWQTVVEAVSQ